MVGGEGEGFCLAGAAAAAAPPPPARPGPAPRSPARPPPPPAPNERCPRRAPAEHPAEPPGRGRPVAPAAPRRPAAPGQPAAHPRPEDAQRPQRPPPAPRVPPAALLHARQPHRAGRQEEPAGAAGPDLLADRQAGPAALLQAQRRGRRRAARRCRQGARRPARRPQAAGRRGLAARRQVQLQALLQGRRGAAQGGRRRRQGRLSGAQRRLPAVPPARRRLARRLPRRLAAARRPQGRRGQEGARGGQGQPRRGGRGARGRRARGPRRAPVGPQVGAARPAARRPCGPRLALQAGPLRLPPAALQHRLPRLHRGRLRRLPLAVRARAGPHQAGAGGQPAAGGAGAAGQAAQLQPADGRLAALLHAGIMQGPVLPELPQRLAPGHRQLLQLRARPRQPEKRIPAGVPRAPAALGAHHALLQRHRQPARPPPLHLRLHAPERPPAPHMQLGVCQRTLRQEVCHLGGAAHPPTDPHGPAGGRETLGGLPRLRAGLGRLVPPPPPARRPWQPQHVTRIPVLEEPTHFGTKQVPPLRQEPLARGRRPARAVLASRRTLLLAIRALRPKTNFSFCTRISVATAAPSPSPASSSPEPSWDSVFIYCMLA